MNHKKSKNLHELYNKGYIKKIRHIYPLIEKENVTTKKEIFKLLEKMQKDDIVRKVVDGDNKEIYFEPTRNARIATTIMIEKEKENLTGGKAIQLSLFKCLWNITHNDEEDHRLRLIKVAEDFNNNYGINVCDLLREKQEMLEGFYLPEDVLKSIENFFNT